MKEIKPFSLFFDTVTGRGENKEVKPTFRYIADMAAQFADEAAAKQLAEGENPLAYEFYELDIPETDGDLKFGTSIVYPGKVGDEYFMTKGHFHTILDTAEVYYCLAGEGVMLMENPEGDVRTEKMAKGMSVYVPGRYAHRSINTGNEPLVMFFVFRSDAGHDYGTIETKGYRKLLVERDGKPTLIDNPKWQ